MHPQEGIIFFFFPLASYRLSSSFLAFLFIYIQTLEWIVFSELESQAIKLHTVVQYTAGTVLPSSSQPRLKLMNFD